MLTIGVAQVLQSDQVIWIEMKSLFEIADGVRCIAFASGQTTEIIPGVRRGFRVGRGQLRGVFKVFARFADLAQLEINAAETVVCFSASWIILQRRFKEVSRSFRVAALEKNRTERKIIPPKLERCGYAREGKRSG